MAKKDAPDKGGNSPWLAGVKGVKGVVPPGRRLSPNGEKRPTRWSASGVKGVTPPGNQKPGEGPAAEWSKRHETQPEAKRKALEQKAQAKALEAKKKGVETDDYSPLRPTAGFVPDAFADAGDPSDMKSFLKALNDFIAENKPSPEVADHFSQLVNQSHAPFEITVAFTLLQAVVGKSDALRRRYGLALERGAKVFYNLATRLDPAVKAPRGLVPETVDALFYDLPASAYALPYAFATDAFCRQFELLRSEADPEYDWNLMSFVLGMREKYIESRSFGDQPLRTLFPWDPPDWTPAELL